MTGVPRNMGRAVNEWVCPNLPGPGLGPTQTVDPGSVVQDLWLRNIGGPNRLVKSPETE